MKRFTLTPDELAAGGFITVQDAAAQIGVTDETIYTAIRRGHLPSTRFGRCVRIPRAAWLRYLMARTKGVEVA